MSNAANINIIGPYRGARNVTINRRLFEIYLSKANVGDWAFAEEPQVFFAHPVPAFDSHVKTGSYPGPTTPRINYYFHWWLIASGPHTQVEFLSNYVKHWELFDFSRDWLLQLEAAATLRPGHQLPSHEPVPLPPPAPTPAPSASTSEGNPSSPRATSQPASHAAATADADDWPDISNGPAPSQSASARASQQQPGAAAADNTAVHERTRSPPPAPTKRERIVFNAGNTGAPDAAVSSRRRRSPSPVHRRSCSLKLGPKVHTKRRGDHIPLPSPKLGRKLPTRN